MYFMWLYLHANIVHSLSIHEHILYVHISTVCCQDKPLESLALVGQKMFDVSTACENALQIDPSPLNVDPHIKESIDPVQSIFPGHGVVFKHLEVGRELHCGHGIDVLLDLVEEIIPAADETTLVLVVDQVKFIGHPGLSHLCNRSRVDN